MLFSILFEMRGELHKDLVCVWYSRSPLLKQGIKHIKGERHAYGFDNAVRASWVQHYVAQLVPELIGDLSVIQTIYVKSDQDFRRMLPIVK